MTQPASSTNPTTQLITLLDKFTNLFTKFLDCFEEKVINPYLVGDIDIMQINLKCLDNKSGLLEAMQTFSKVLQLLINTRIKVVQNIKEDPLQKQDMKLATEYLNKRLLHLIKFKNMAEEDIPDEAMKYTVTGDAA